MRFIVASLAHLGADGPVMVKLDDHRYAHAMTTNLFDVVEAVNVEGLGHRRAWCG